MKVKELLDSPDKWCKNNFAIDANGNPVSIFSPDAVAFCLSGAIARCYNILTAINTEWEIEEELEGPIEEWNDAPGRTFADIQILITQFDL